MHPTARIVLYLISALVLPGLSHFGLGCVLGVTLPTLARRAPQVGRLLWRTRWLFLLLFLGNAYSHPGTAVWLGAEWLSPTWQGLAAGASHVLRLLAILLLLDALVLAMPRTTQLAGIHGLLAPFSFLGLDAGRATVRLGLTLDAMEQPPTRRGGLREIFGRADAESEGESSFLLALAPWRARDGMLLLSGGMAMILLWRFA
jgi:hypothetical protein